VKPILSPPTVRCCHTSRISPRLSPAGRSFELGHNRSNHGLSLVIDLATESDPMEGWPTNKFDGLSTVMVIEEESTAKRHQNAWISFSHPASIKCATLSIWVTLDHWPSSFSFSRSLWIA
jgi:hypothetical protein